MTGKIHDLSLTYEEGMRGVSFQPVKTLENDGWNALNLTLYSHSGTHMDASVHFGIEGPTIDHIHPDQLIVDAWVVDATQVGPKGLIEVEHLGKVADQFIKREGLLLKTGWSAYVNEPKYRDELPRISESLAHWCVDHEVRILGVEPPSVADVNNMEEVTLIHQILFRGNVTIVEGLTNLEAIDSEKIKLIALPLRIKNGDGAPARVIAIEK